MPARSLAASRFLVSSSRWQDWRWPGSSETGARAGSTSLQIGITYGQRGWKRQPVGGFSIDGGWPWICTRRSTSASRRGSEPISPHVYGWWGFLKICSTPPFSATSAAYMTTTSSAISATTPRAWDADGLQELERTCARRLPRDVFVQAHRLGELLPDLVHRVQARHRVLED